jgi:regulator of sigma E protease
MSYLIGIAGLLFLVFIHELGHFLVAKGVGARATKFYVGFPPAILKFQRGDTEYGLGAIPLGGYVRIPGMSRPQPTDLYRVIDAADEARLRRPDDEEDHLTPAVNAVSAALAVGPGQARGVIGEARAALERDRELLLAKTYAQAAKDLDRITEDVDVTAHWTLAVWKQIAISVAGPAANVLAAVVILAVAYMVGSPVLRNNTTVASVSADTPALAAGLQAGDRVVAIAGSPVADGDQLRARIAASHGASIVISVVRGKARVDLPSVAPRLDASSHRYLLGFTTGADQVGSVSDAPPRAVVHAVSQSWWVVRESFAALGGVFTAKGRENVQGPVGIVASSASAVDQGYYAFELAFISLALAIANMLPILPLDGGHVFWALVGVARGGRPVPRSIIDRAALIGIAVFALLAIVMANQDIGRLLHP